MAEFSNMARGGETSLGHSRIWARNGASPVLSLCALALFALALIGVAELALAHVAFLEGTPESVRAASAIGNADYVARWADLDPARRIALLQHAVLLNPSASSIWIELGLASEREGELRAAREAFEWAIAIDHQYLPQWTLANFCFRHSDETCFFEAASRAASLVFDDLRPLLMLAERILPDPGQALVKLEKPLDAASRDKLERAFLDLLISEAVSGRRSLADAMPVALAMAHHGQADVPRLEAYFDRLIEAGHGASACELWNALHPRALRHDLRLVNGELRERPSSTGFDWRLTAAPGVKTIWVPGEIEFVLNGGQPERFEMLWQPIVEANRNSPRESLVHGSRYRLRFRYRTEDGGDWSAGAPTGIIWVATAVPAPSERKVSKTEFIRAAVRTAPPLQESPDLSASPVWRSQTWDFGLSTSELFRLALVYRRSIGSRRAEGALQIQDVRLEEL